MTNAVDEVRIPTRVAELAADVYLPAGLATDGCGGEPVPALVAASPYQKALGHLPVHGVFPFREGGPIAFYQRHGYAYVWIDVPGSGASQGTWDPVSRAEGTALYDAIEWVAAQPWCSGRVGMIGQSYFCWSHWNAARMAPPSLATIAAFDGGSDLYRDWLYKGGIPDFGFISSWTASVLLQHQATGHPIDGGDRHLHLANVYAHPFDDDWHHDHSPFWGLEDVTIPALSIGAWPKGSLHMRGNVEGFRRLAGPRRLRMLSARNPGEVQRLYATEAFHERELLPWYEHHLKGVDNGVMDGPAVRLEVNRSGAQRAAMQWPPEQAAPAVFHLDPTRSGVVGSLNDGSLSPDGPVTGASVTSFSYPDPEWAIGTTAMGPDGPDHTARILTFTSAPMQHRREFTGDGVIELYGSTDQDDFDVVARLAVIGRDGAGAEIVSPRLAAGLAPGRGPIADHRDASLPPPRSRGPDRARNRVSAAHCAGPDVVRGRPRRADPAGAQLRRLAGDRGSDVPVVRAEGRHRHLPPRWDPSLAAGAAGDGSAGGGLSEPGRPTLRRRRSGGWAEAAAGDQRASSALISRWASGEPNSRADSSVAAAPPAAIVARSSAVISALVSARP